MGGTHRGKPDHSAPIALLAVVVVVGAVIAFVVYLGLAHQSAIFIVVSVVDVVIVIQFAHRLVLRLGSNQPTSAEETVNRLSLAAQLAAAVIATLASIGQVRGWMHGPFQDAVVGLMIFYLLGASAYWSGGKRRLIAALTARAAGEPPGPSG